MCSNRRATTASSARARTTRAHRRRSPSPTRSSAVSGSARRAPLRRAVRLERSLQLDGVRGHDPVDTPVDELAPVLRAVDVLVAEPGVHRVPGLVGAGDVVRGRDVEELVAELERDRELEGDASLGGWAAVQDPAGYAGDARRDADGGLELVEAIDGGLLERDHDEVVPVHTRELPGERFGVVDVLGGLLVLGAPLDLDVDGRLRKGLQHGSQGRDAEVGRLEALGRAALAGGDAAERVRVRPAVMGVVLGAVRREPVAGVEGLDLRQRLLGDETAPVGRAVDAGVVHDDDLVVARDADVELEHVGAGAVALRNAYSVLDGNSSSPPWWAMFSTRRFIHGFASCPAGAGAASSPIRATRARGTTRRRISARHGTRGRRETGRVSRPAKLRMTGAPRGRGGRRDRSA